MMSSSLLKPTLWQRVAPVLGGWDVLLVLAVLGLSVMGLFTMYSAGFDHGTRFWDHARNMLLAWVILLAMAYVPPHRLMWLALPLYTVGVALLIATAVAGITKKGAMRWLDIGMGVSHIVIQPSEILKIATPLMLAWWFQKREGQLQSWNFGVALVLLAIPVGLIVKQPDLGTAVLVFAAGLYVVFLAGLSWRLVGPALLILILAVAALVMSQEKICQPNLEWPLLHDYQKNRVCTLLDPATDPLGKGFHTIQGMIAIGSGGLHGKGFMKGTQTHLDFIPERTTDFVFAAFSEEFGLVGCLSLVAAFTLLIFRGLWIAARAPTVFSRLLAGAISLSFFTYAFVNMGMVSGILPVVGVPLPFISYGGTAMVTLCLGLGMLMSIAKSRQPVVPQAFSSITVRGELTY
jgi:rod shape determining protein RodA